MELKNYINVRVQSHNNDKIIGVMKHNLRNIKSLNQENNDINFFYDFDNNKWLEMNNENKKSEYQKLSKKFKQDREEHTNLNMKKNGRNIQDKRQGSYFEGVFTFSEKINEDLGNLYSLEDLAQVSSKCLEQIAAKYKTQIRGLYLHMDETTPHFHFLLKNFNENDMSLYFKNKNKKFLSELQDLVFENFKILGMKRGQKKEITKKTYKTTKRHKEELETQLKDLNEELEEQKEIKKKLEDKNIDLEEKICIKEYDIKQLEEDLEDLNKDIEKLNPNKKLEEENIKLEEHINYYRKELKRKNDELEENRDKIIVVKWLEIDINSLKEKNKKLEEELELRKKSSKTQMEEIRRLKEFEDQSIDLEEQNITIKNRLEEFEKRVKENNHLFPFFEDLFEYEDKKQNRDIKPKIRMNM